MSAVEWGWLLLVILNIVLGCGAAWAGRWVVVVIAAVTLIVSLIGLSTAAGRRADREVQTCLDHGGIPDRSGRYGNRVHCYERPDR